MKTDNPKQRVAPFCYTGSDTRRHVLSRLRRLQRLSGRNGKSLRVRRRTLFRNASADAAAKELRTIRDDGRMLSVGQLKQLKRNRRMELAPEVLAPFTKKIMVTEVDNVGLKMLANFSLTLAPANNMPVISPEMWLKGESILVGGFIEVIDGETSAIEDILQLLGVVRCRRS